MLAAVVAFAASYVTWPLLRTIPWFFFFAAIMVERLVRRPGTESSSRRPFSS